MLSAEYVEINFREICASCPENCCKRYYAVLLPGEEERIPKVLKPFEIMTKYGCVKAIGAREGLPCPALSSGGYCTVYNERPFDCRIYPLVVYLDEKTGEKVAYLDLGCPAVREGRISKDLIEKLLKLYRSVNVSDEWLRRYTHAPWHNRFIEITRWK